MKYIVSKYVITEPVYKVLDTTYEKYYNDGSQEGDDNHEYINFGEFNSLFWNMVSESEYYKDFATYYCHIEPKETIEVLDDGKILKFVTTYTLGDDKREEKYEDEYTEKNTGIFIPGISNQVKIDLTDTKTVDRIEQYIISTENLYDYDKVIPGKFLRFEAYYMSINEETGEEMYDLSYRLYNDWRCTGEYDMKVKDTRGFLKYINPDPNYTHNIGMDINMPGGINLANKDHIKKAELYISIEKNIPVGKIKLTSVGISTCITLIFYYDIVDKNGKTISSHTLDGVNMKEFRKFLGK